MEPMTNQQYAFTFRCYNKINSAIDEEDGYQQRSKDHVTVTVAAVNEEAALTAVKAVVAREAYRLDGVVELLDNRPISNNE